MTGLFGDGHYKLNPDHSVTKMEVTDTASLIAWAKEVWDETDNRRVAYTEVAPGIWVSTVFLGLDHGWGGGPPLLFETMTFTDYGDDGQWRWSTWDDAAAGHESIVRRVKERLNTGANRDNLEESPNDSAPNRNHPH